MTRNQGAIFGVAFDALVSVPGCIITELWGLGFGLAYIVMLLSAMIALAVWTDEKR